MGGLNLTFETNFGTISSGMPRTRLSGAKRFDIGRHLAQHRCYNGQGHAALASEEERASLARSMDDSVGSRVRVKLYGGKIIKAALAAIVNQSTGRKIRIFSKRGGVVISPEQMIEVLPQEWCGS